MSEKRSRTRRPGELESEVMRILWAAPDGLTVHDVCAAFDPPAPAYTTIATVLTRLLTKEKVERIGSAREGYRFRPTHSQVEHASAQMLSALGESADRRAALLNFAGNLDSEDIALLREAFKD